MNIYLAKNGEQTGPYSEDQVKEMLESGSVEITDPAWRKGLSAWEPLHRVMGLCLPARIPPQPISPPPQIVATGPKGVGGFLLFFCISLTIISPLMTLTSLARSWFFSEALSEEHPAMKTAWILESLGFLALLVYGVVTGCAIWSGSPKGRMIARWYLLIQLIGSLAINLMGVFVIWNLPKEYVVSGAIGTFLNLPGSVAYFLIWWLYFENSKRVRNTYAAKRPEVRDSGSPSSTAGPVQD